MGRVPALSIGASTVEPAGGSGSRRATRLARAPTAAYLALILAMAAALRVWQLNSTGFNSDEAVYAGQAAAIADHPELGELFPVFRAHPLLVQTVLSVGFQLHLAEGFERLTVAAIGVATVYLVYELGRLLYGRRGRADRRVADGADALPRRRHAPGAARRTDDVLRHAHAPPAGPLRAQRPRVVAVRAPARRWDSRSCRRRPASSCSERSTPSWR